MQETMNKIQAYLDTNNIAEWNDVKAQLDYTEYPNMLKAVRHLEQQGYLTREAHTDNGQTGVRLHKVVA